MDTRTIVTVLCLGLVGVLCGCGGSGGGGLPVVVPGDGGVPAPPRDGGPYPQTLTEVSPITGTTLGGTIVTLKGTGFLHEVFEIHAVLFGEKGSPNWEILDDETIVAESPPGLRGDTTIYLIGDNAPENDGVLLLSGFTYVAPIVYVAQGAGAAAPRLWEVDLATNLVTLVGTIGFEIDGMSMAADGNLYGVESSAPHRLIRISTATGAGTAVALLRDSVTALPVEIRDVTFVADELYGRTAGNALVHIDMAFGTVTALEDPLPAPFGSALVAVQGGQLLLSSDAPDGLLYEHDPISGVTRAGPSVPFGVAFDSLAAVDALLYGIDAEPSDPAEVDLFRIDLATGEVLAVAVLPPFASAIARER